MHDRSQRVHDRFVTHYLEMHGDVRIISTDEWDRVAPFDPTNSHRFGWIPPNGAGHDDFVVWLCPEVIVAQTADLDDVFFAAYLDVIQFICDLSVAYREVDDPYERSRMIDKRLWDIAEGSMRLLTDVQMRALDAAG